MNPVLHFWRWTEEIKYDADSDLFILTRNDGRSLGARGELLKDLCIPALTAFVEEAERGQA